MKKRLTLPISIWLASGAVLLAPMTYATNVPGPAVVSFAGPQFEGGAKDLVGTSFHGEEVNTIYAQSTGPRSRMQIKFNLTAIPTAPLFVHLRGLDDDARRASAIAVRLNNTVLFEGPNPFSAAKFEIRKWPIPNHTLVLGENLLVIASLEKAGSAGSPPWFQVAFAAIAPDPYVIREDLHQQFAVTLPAELRPFPELLPAGQSPGFKWRGTKGWGWSAEQYLEEIPWLAKFKMNFLMNCYISMFDIEHHPNWADGEANRWWEELPPTKKAAYEKVVRSCQEHHLEFCFAMNPNLTSKRFITADSTADLDALYQHYDWMQSLGVRWFNISLDDITQGIDAVGHARVVNTIFRRLRAKDPQAQMIFCPTFYWGDGTGKEQQPYLEILARELDSDVYLFWTGDAVVGPVSRKAAETFRRIGGHRVFLWDNYPVNDDAPTMHLGPVVDRDPDLGEVIDGYMGNPLRKQNQGNRLPLATCADYAYNPRAYDPSRSIGQAILQVAEQPEQRAVLRELVEAYAGMLIWSPPARSTSFNTVRHRFDEILALRNSRLAARAYVDYLSQLAARLQKAFPDSFLAEREILRQDLKVISDKLRQRYPES
ncbi:MAG: protein O-GlcNAcase [Verrucomicrobiae bacterium]|nr:protein O-GlcNAcase [Verrucomicrobiae bacterium]